MDVEQKTIYDYNDFRAFLGDWYASEKLRRGKFTKAEVSRLLGLPNSRNYFSDLLGARSFPKPSWSAWWPSWRWVPPRPATSAPWCVSSKPRLRKIVTSCWNAWWPSTDRLAPSWTARAWNTSAIGGTAR